MGCPGHRGQISFAALSQTVKTKSIRGASAFANSSQLLLRRPSVEARASSICFSASGRTTPDGWLPALYAAKFGRPFRLRMASAMIDRAEFPVHRNKTLYFFSIAKPLPDARNCRRSGRRWRATIRRTAGFFGGCLLRQIVFENSEYFPLIPVGIM